jgi:prepilin-type N-terminal cleavage/methylation domain-containing protein
MYLKQKKGFTLIEMLIVIAVIGLLSSVLLTALGPARDKAKDSRIMQEISQIRALAEVMYNGTYSALPELPSLNPISNKDLEDLVNDINSEGGEVNIIKSNDQRSYVIFTPLNSKVFNSDTNTYEFQYYCLDSGGKSAILKEPLDPYVVKQKSVATCK